MPERTFSSPEYRYGFNGKEKDENREWGSLTHYDYGFRIYNPGIGRFLSVDPMTPSYPWYTPYQFAGNGPIMNIDIDGLEEYHYVFSTEDLTTGVCLVSVNDYHEVNSFPSMVQGLTFGLFGRTPVNESEVHQIHTGQYVEYFLDNAYGAGIHKEEIILTYNSYEELVKDAPSYGDKIEQRREVLYWSAKGAQGLGNVASEQHHYGTGARIGKDRIPQGLTGLQFERASKTIRQKAGNISDDIVVQGSRASRTATKKSDIDIAIKVDQQKFDQLLEKSFGNVRQGSAKERTKLHAIKTGKITSGEAGLRGLRKDLEAQLGMKVDISIIKSGGKFDNGAQLPIIE